MMFGLTCLLVSKVDFLICIAYSGMVRFEVHWVFEYNSNLFEVKLKFITSCIKIVYNHCSGVFEVHWVFDRACPGCLAAVIAAVPAASASNFPMSARAASSSRGSEVWKGVFLSLSQT